MGMEKSKNFLLKVLRCNLTKALLLLLLACLVR